MKRKGGTFSPSENSINPEETKQKVEGEGRKRKEKNGGASWPTRTDVRNFFLIRDFGCFSAAHRELNKQRSSSRETDGPPPPWMARTPPGAGGENRPIWPPSCKLPGAEDFFSGRGKRSALRNRRLHFAGRCFPMFR